jgi:hypothetical protein
VKSLLDSVLGIKGESSIDLGGDLARDDLQDLLTKLNQETVESGIGLLVGITAVLLSVCDGLIDQLGVLGLLRGSEDEGWVGGGILRLVLGDGCSMLDVYLWQCFTTD